MKLQWRLSKYQINEIDETTPVACFVVCAGLTSEILLRFSKINKTSAPFTNMD